MAAEWRERQRVQQEAGREAKATAEIRNGSAGAIFGRILLPGELPPTLPVDSGADLFGSEESQLLDPWNRQ